MLIKARHYPSWGRGAYFIWHFLYSRSSIKTFNRRNGRRSYCGEYYPPLNPFSTVIDASMLKITGVSGYIGFKTMYMALAQGYQVRAIVRKEEQISKLKNHPKVTNIANLSFVVVPDLVAKDAFAGVFDGAKAIVHLASPLAIEVGLYPTGRNYVRNHTLIGFCRQTTMTGTL